MEEPEPIGLMKQAEQMNDRHGGIQKLEYFLRKITFNAVFFEAVSKVKSLT
jgi:hypothetical protein